MLRQGRFAGATRLKRKAVSHADLSRAATAVARYTISERMLGLMGAVTQSTD